MRRRRKTASIGALENKNATANPSWMGRLDGVRALRTRGNPLSLERDFGVLELN